jgi:hypothetical protein
MNRESRIECLECGERVVDGVCVRGHRDDPDVRYAAELPDSEGSRIVVLRRIVERHQYEKIDGYLVDATTAQLLVRVYETLDRPGGLFEQNPERRAAFDRLPLPKLVDFAWSMVEGPPGVAVRTAHDGMS